MLEFKDSTHVWGRRGAMWLELAESFPFFLVFPFLLYGLLKGRARRCVRIKVCGGNVLRRKVSFSSVKYSIAVLSGWRGKGFGRVLD